MQLKLGYSELHILSILFWTFQKKSLSGYCGGFKSDCAKSNAVLCEVSPHHANLFILSYFILYLSLSYHISYLILSHTISFPILYSIFASGCLHTKPSGLCYSSFFGAKSEINNLMMNLI